MTFNWADYLKFAKKVKQIAEVDDKEMPFYAIQEAAHRAVISRAYYAVFCICRNYILENHSDKILLEANNPKVHGEVIRFFKESGEAKQSKIGKILGEVRDYRNNADYDNELEDSLQNLSSNAIEQANTIMEIIKIL
jgi:uncharacterized protein (UPF0332 family)